MEGHDFQVVGEDIKDYTCPICLLLLRHAILLPCSHSACKECLAKWEEQADSGVHLCPSCQSVYDSEKVHKGKEGRFIDRVVTTSLKVRCKHHLKRCEWVGTISDYEIHEKSCPYAPVNCTFSGCSAVVSRKDLDVHKCNCSYRIVRCTFCEEEFLYNQLEDHLVCCNYYVVACQSGCGRSLERKDVQAHIANDCPNTEITCPFQEIGCSQRVLRSALVDHLNDPTQQHTNLLLQCTLKLTKEVTDLKQSNIELHMEIQQLKDSSSIRICELEEKLEQKEREVFVVNKKVDTIENRLNQDTDQISKDLKLISRSIFQLEVKLKDDQKKTNKEILLELKKSENFNAKIEAALSLSAEHRSKQWSYHELSSLVQSEENERFGAIINWRPELALLCASNEYSLLHCACSYNNTSAIDVLVKNGCPISQEDISGWKPIHQAAVHGFIDAARLLLSIDKTLVNSINTQNKKTPLHCAIIWNREEFVKYLLTQPGISVNLKDKKNKMADEYNFKIQQMIRGHSSFKHQ